MIKLLVNTPSGIQEIIEVDQSGGYFDQSRIVWDERKDGPLPAVTPGGLVKNAGGQLVIDPAKKNAHDSAVTTKRLAEEKVLADKQERRSLFLNIQKITTVAETKLVLAAIISHLGLDK